MQGDNKDNDLRKCRRCLIYRDADEAAKKSFDMLINGIPDNERSTAGLYDGRLAVCESCEFLNAGTCRACGCFVELRAAMKASGCPYKYWDK